MASSYVHIYLCFEKMYVTETSLECVPRWAASANLLYKSLAPEAKLLGSIKGLRNFIKARPTTMENIVALDPMAVFGIRRTNGSSFPKQLACRGPGGST